MQVIQNYGFKKKEQLCYARSHSFKGIYDICPDKLQPSDHSIHNWTMIFHTWQYTLANKPEEEAEKLRVLNKGQDSILHTNSSYRLKNNKNWCWEGEQRAKIQQQMKKDRWTM